VLFDLRSPGRRRAIKVIYTFLALLMGVGLVGFGIGGNVSGGIFDVGGGCGGNDPNNAFQEEVDNAEERVKQQPRNAAAWAALTRARYQVAGSGDNFDAETGVFTAEGRRELADVQRAWNRYLAVEPEKPDPTLASLMVQAFVGLNKPAEAVKAQRIVTEAKPSPNAFFQLAVYAYAAGDKRTGDLASRRALELTPRDLRPSLKERLDAAKEQASGAAGGGAQPAPSG